MDRNRDRGQLTNSTFFKVIAAIAIGGLVFAFLIPVAINEMEGDVSETLTQDTSTERVVNSALNSTVTGTTDGSDATVELNATGDSAVSKTINVGNEKTYSFSRGDVVANVTEATSSNATVRYEYPREFAFSDGARSIWGLISLAIVLAGVLMFIGYGLRMRN